MKIDVFEKQIVISEDNISINMDFIEPIDSSKLEWYIEDLKTQFIKKKQEIELFKSVSSHKIKLPYDQMRRNEYPSIEQQLDMLYWDLMNGTDKWRDKITEIKTKYPKPDLK